MSANGRRERRKEEPMTPIFRLIAEQAAKPPGPVSTAIMQRWLQEQIAKRQFAK
jgi:hypothetical protein